MTTIETTTLRDGMAGQVVTPDDPGYDKARAIYNAMIDRRPAVIARCRSVADVRAALEYGRRSGLAIAVRGGGHNGPGFGTVEGGLVIDLSEMDAVVVDPAARTVRVQRAGRLGGQPGLARPGLAADQQDLAGTLRHSLPHGLQDPELVVAAHEPRPAGGGEPRWQGDRAPRRHARHGTGP